MTMRNRLTSILMIVVCVSGPLRAEASERFDVVKGEKILQAFFDLWARDEGVTEANVAKLYAPRIIYYGKPFSRAGVLREKMMFARQWPYRDYRDVPGSLRASCVDRGARCTLRALITWRRATRNHQVSTGRAELSLEFAGDRKIVRERARIL